jgi:hypothetical protein
MRVWVSSWQQECCGDPFRVGGEVRWTLQEPDLDFARSILGDALAASITHDEDHHGDLPDDALPTVGTVTAIKVVACAYSPGPAPHERTLYPISGSGVLRDRVQVSGAVPVDEGLQLVGYLVDIEPA